MTNDSRISNNSMIVTKGQESSDSILSINKSITKKNNPPWKIGRLNYYSIVLFQNDAKLFVL